MKRLCALLLSAFLVLSLLACGSQPAPEETQPRQWHDAGTVSITKEQVETIVSMEFTTPKNVIIIIGDGMGANDIELAEKHTEGVYDFGMVLNQIPHHGMCTTHSANNPVTDSAAAATALATGVKTNNGYVGIDPEQRDLQNMVELARNAGKKVGIVTDDLITGGTPAGFVAHNISRNNDTELERDIMAFGLDVLIGKYDYIHMMRSTKHGYNTANSVEEFQTVLESAEDLSKPFVGFNMGFTGEVSDDLSHCVQTALNLLKNDNGFFLMIESSGTDKYGHKNMLDQKLPCVVNLDRTVAAVLLFMQENPDTLLVITSDHETGGLQLPDGELPPTNTLFTVTTHTETQVRVFALGQGSEYFQGKIVDNTDIAKFLQQAIIKAPSAP